MFCMKKNSYLQKLEYLAVPIILLGVFLRTPIFWTLGRDFKQFFYENFFVGKCLLLYDTDSWYWFGKFYSEKTLCFLSYYPLIAFIFSCILIYFAFKKLFGIKFVLLGLLFFVIQKDIYRNTFMGYGDSNALIVLILCFCFFLFVYKYFITSVLLLVSFLTFYSRDWIKKFFMYVFIPDTTVQELSSYDNFLTTHLMIPVIIAWLIYHIYTKENKKFYSLILIIFCFATFTTKEVVRFDLYYGILYTILVVMFFYDYLFDKKEYIKFVFCFLLLVIIIFPGEYFVDTPFVDKQTFNALSSMRQEENRIMLGFWSMGNVVCGISGNHCINQAYPHSADYDLHNIMSSSNETKLYDFFVSTNSYYLYFTESDRSRYKMVNNLWNNNSKYFFVHINLSKNYKLPMIILKEKEVENYEEDME